MKLKLIVCLVLLNLAHSHPNGAPRKSCKSLLPHHKHIRYDETSAQFKTFVIDGSNVKIEIESEQPFKGFILQVRSKGNHISGRFEDGEDYKLMKCNHVRGNSITHKNSHHKTRIETKWINEEGLTDFVIEAVVVFDYKRAQKLRQEMSFEYTIVHF